MTKFISGGQTPLGLSMIAEMKAHEFIHRIAVRAYPRRALLAAAAGMVLIVAECALFQAPGLRGRVGLQLYSLRNQLSQDVPGTLALVEQWGIKYVELAGTYHMSNKEFHHELVAHHLEAVSGHFGFDEWAKDPEAVIRQAKELGLKYAGCAWIPHNGPFDEAAARHAIEVFNRAGKAAAAAHLQFFYHTHGYEFAPMGDGTVFDMLVKETNPRDVKFEMDIFWVAHAGQDCARLLEKYPDRWALMHLKDMRAGTETGILNGASSVHNDVALGTGILDIPGILRAAEHVHVRYYFIEDESPDSEQQIPVTLKYLAAFRK